MKKQLLSILFLSSMVFMSQAVRLDGKESNVSTADNVKKQYQCGLGMVTGFMVKAQQKMVQKRVSTFLSGSVFFNGFAKHFVNQFDFSK